jgi:predicted alpha/beta-fold hydrolase
LARNNELLNKGFFRRRIYAETLGGSVVELLKFHSASFSKFPDSPTTKKLPSIFLLKRPTMEDYDNAFTRFIGGESPLFPMETARDYYEWASSHKVIRSIAVPYLSINAADDPIVQEVPTDCEGNGWVAMLITRHGGHLGWFGQGADRWIQKPVLEFLQAAGEGMIHEAKGRSVYIDGEFIREAGRDDLGCKVVDYRDVFGY